MNKNELELWLRFKSGEINALFIIYEFSYGELMLNCQRITRDRELIKDTINQFFIYIWDKRATISQPQNLRNYLAVSVKRALLHELKKLGKINDVQHLLDTESILSHEDGIIQEQSDLELAFKMRKAIEKLSKRKQELVRLKYYEGLSYDEIAATTQLNLRTIYNKLHEAIQFLKKEFSK